MQISLELNENTDLLMTAFCNGIRNYKKRFYIFFLVATNNTTISLYIHALLQTKHNN